MWLKAAFVLKSRRTFPDTYFTVFKMNSRDEEKKTVVRKFDSL